MSRDDDRDERYDDRPRRRRPEDEPLTREELKRRVKPPGIALLAVAVLSLLAIGYGVYDYFVNFDKAMAAEKAKIDANPTASDAQKQTSKDMMDQVANVLRVAMPGVWVVEGILSLVMLFGSTKLMSASSLGWGRTAAVLALIPCHGCWVVGIGVGVWALVVLSNPQVKAAFADTGRRDEYDDRDDRRD